MKRMLLIAAVAGFAWSSTAAAQQVELGYPADSLGMNAILSGDYATAERQIRASSVSKYDPARALNLGLVFAKTGRTDKAARQFQRVLSEEDIELVLADGRLLSSHDAARQSLASLSPGR